VPGGERAFLVELDTVPSFTSAFKKQFHLPAALIARVPVELADTDTVAYYWRTKLEDPLPGESSEWTISTFTYIRESPEGWAQVHFPQFLANETHGLVPDAVHRKLYFKESSTTVDVINFGAGAGKPRDSVSVKIAGAEYNLYAQAGGGFGCRNNTINLIAFDRKSTTPYAGIYFKWYEILYNYGGRRLICGREPFVINSFTPHELSTGNHDDLIQYINNVALGDSVVLYNIGDAGYNLWPAAAIEKLEELGIAAAQIEALQPGEPVVIFGKKGAASGSAKVYRSNAAEPDKARLEVNGTVTGGFTNGTFRTQLIGPALAWKRFIPQTTDVEEHDEVFFAVHGVSLDGAEQLLYEHITSAINLQDIDADTYPYLKVMLHVHDELNLTPAQLNKWIVLYEPVPEGLLVHRGRPDAVTIEEGELWTDTYSFVNISDRFFPDSLLVRYTMFNREQRKSLTRSVTIKSPAPGDSTHFAITIPSLGYEGRNDLDVFVNPRIVAEQYYDNNVLEWKERITVTGDYQHPVLEVTFDGRILTNGDFVSPNPLIGIRLWDENQYRLKTDTTGMRIFLTYPCESGCVPRPVWFSSSEIKWYPATPTNNFNVEYRPQTLPEGKYTLRVEGRDAKGNSSGNRPYEITFFVAHQTGADLMPPYPNPFQGMINFPFILRGDALPQAFTLQLYNLAGKSMATMSITDEKTFFIGKNEFVWNTSESALPNGMYLYRWVIVVNDQRYEKQGKLVLHR
jgi:hypothetical protein